MHFATHPAARARRQTLAPITSSVLSAAALPLAPASHATTTGSSNAASEVRAASGFQAIALLSSSDLVVRQGNSECVMVRADDNILPLVQTSVEGSGDARTLRSQVKAGESLRPKTPVMVTVDVVTLNALASSGSGNITIEALKAPMLTVSISGSSDARLRELDTERLNISIADSGDASARAQRTISRAIAGSGKVDYGGGATLARRSIAGSGKLRHRQP